MGRFRASGAASGQGIECCAVPGGLDLYRPEDLVGKLVVAVVIFPKKQIGPLMSECLVTGFHDERGAVALCVPDRPVPVGTKLL